MSALDILRARALAIQYARPATGYCKGAGIDWLKTEAATGGLFLAPVVADPPRSFLVDPAGAPAVVIDVMDETGRVADLVSWRPANPGRWRTITGQAPALGMARATNPNLHIEGLPLRIWRTPQRWLQNECTGIVPLDVRGTMRWLIDFDGVVKTLAPEDDDHAAEIDAARHALVAGQRLVPAARRVREAA